MTAVRFPISPPLPAPVRRLPPPPLGKCSSPNGAGQWLFCGELAGSPALQRASRRQLQPLEWRAANPDSRPLVYRRPQRLEIDEWQQPPMRQCKSISPSGRYLPAVGSNASPQCAPTLSRGPDKSYSTPNLRPIRPRVVPIAEPRRQKRSRHAEGKASLLSWQVACGAEEKGAEHPKQRCGAPKSMHEWGMDSDEETANKELEQTLPRSRSSPLAVPSFAPDAEQRGHNAPTLGHWHDADQDCGGSPCAKRGDSLPGADSGLGARHGTPLWKLGQVNVGKLRSSASTPLPCIGSTARKHRDKNLALSPQGDQSPNRNSACSSPQAADTAAIEQLVESELSKLHTQYSSLSSPRTPRLLEEELIGT